VLEKQKKETLNQSIERERKRGNILSLLLKYNQLDFSTNISKQLEIHPCKFFPK
jgi:nitrate reductase NapAB chaperone NapD